MPCPTCRRDHKRSKNGPCARCYKLAYQQTPNGKKAVADANKKWIKANPEARFRHVVTYREKTGYYVPTELHALCNAVKRLEKALETTSNNSRFREPSKRRLHASTERGNWFERSQRLQSARASRGAIDDR